MLAGCTEAETQLLGNLNTPPVADAGPDREVRANESVSLEGRGYDADGDALVYRWTLIERPEGSTSEIRQPDSATTTLRIDRAGRYQLQLIVDDGMTMSTPDVVLLTTANGPPAVDAGSDQEVEVGEVVALRGSASDPEGDTMSFEWTLSSGPNRPTLVGATTLAPRFTASAAGVYELELAVTTQSVTVRDTVRIRSGLMNRPPVAEAGPQQSATRGDRVMLDGTASRDPDGDPLSFTWRLRRAPPGSLTSLEGPSTPNPELATDVAGTYEIDLIVSDGLLSSPPDSVLIIARDDVPMPNADILDPNEVYIFGTVSPGSCGRSIITHWTTPHQGAVGFDCYTNEGAAIIAPGRNRLLFFNTFEDRLREFHCDGACVLTGNGALQYPRNPMANDPILPTPPCDAAGSRLAQFSVWPDGAVIHRCPSRASGWLDDQGIEVIGLTDELIALGRQRSALVQVRNEYAIINTLTSSVTPVLGLPERPTLITSRSRVPSGFWVVVSDEDQPQLWSIDATGIASQVFTYAPAPQGYQPNLRGRLDAQQNLFQTGRGPETFEDIIVRSERGGPTTVVYTEADHPFVQLHISDIVTGP